MSLGSDAWKLPPNADARFAPPPLDFRNFAGSGVKLAYHLAPLEPLLDGVGYRLILNGVVGVVGTEAGPRDAFGVQVSFVDNRQTVEAACVVADRAIEGIIGCLTSLASGVSDAASPVLVSSFTLETAEGLVIEGESSVWEQPAKPASGRLNAPPVEGGSERLSQSIGLRIQASRQFVVELARINTLVSRLAECRRQLDPWRLSDSALFK